MRRRGDEETVRKVRGWDGGKAGRTEEASQSKEAIARRRDRASFQRPQSVQACIADEMEIASGFTPDLTMFCKSSIDFFQRPLLAQT